MPPRQIERQAVMHRLFGLFKRLTGDRIELAALVLSRGEERLLDAHDGLPGELHLSPTQFAELQACWEQHGLPPDLYYPAQEQRTVSEPVEKYGGVVRMYQKYSPLQWAHRNHAAIEARAIPSEEERRERFAQESERYAEDLMRRAFEFLEPGPGRDVIKSQRLIKLSVEVGSLAYHTRHPGEPRSERTGQ